MKDKKKILTNDEREMLYRRLCVLLTGRVGTLIPRAQLCSPFEGIFDPAYCIHPPKVAKWMQRHGHVQGADESCAAFVIRVYGKETARVILQLLD